MQKSVAGLLLVMCVFVSSKAYPLDQSYVKSFGWGKVLVSEKGYPAFDRMDPALFDASGGKFRITGGANREMAVRVLLKDGKTYDYYVDRVKKANAQKAKTLKKTFLRTYIYVSNDIDGRQFFARWPDSAAQKPKGDVYATIENNFEKGWVSSGITAQNFREDASSFMRWLENARPGWTAYFVHVAGFVRDAPELKYWDKSLLQWMTPIEYVESEPIAVGEVVIASTTNPTLAWSHKVLSMPASTKGEDRGELAVLKDGVQRATYRFNTKLSYQNQVTKQYNYYIAFYRSGGNLIGTFPVQCPDLDACVTNAFYECIKRQVAEGTIEEQEPAAAALPAVDSGTVAAPPATPSQPSTPAPATIKIPKFW